MAKPVKPSVPPPALRSDPETFAGRVEGNLVFWPAHVNYMDTIATYVDQKANALLLGALPPLTGYGWRVVMVNGTEDGLVLLTSEGTREKLGLRLGIDVQHYHANLTDLASNGFATAAEYRKAHPDKVLKANVVWDAMAEVTLTDAASIAWNMDLGYDFTVTLKGNRMLANPTNARAGKRGRIRVVQDVAGSRTLSFGNLFEFFGMIPPTLSTTSGDEDILYYDCISPTRIILTLGKKLGKASP